MKKYTWIVLFLMFCFPSWGQIQKTYHYGVIPTENITTFEVNPSITTIDASKGISTSQMTLKAYRVINEEYNWGIEVPLVRFESPEKSVSGLGDTAVNATWFQPNNNDRLAFGAKMEFFLPTATDKRLGSGKFQASPSVYAVLFLPENMYAAVGYKHYVSLFGDHAREDINFGRIRLNIGYTSPDEWWVLTNLYYYMDFEHSGKAEFVPEVEVGTLVNDGVAFYINGSTHAAGNWDSKDWSLGVGFKLLYL